MKIEDILTEEEKQEIRKIIAELSKQNNKQTGSEHIKEPDNSEEYQENK